MGEHNVEQEIIAIIADVSGYDTEEVAVDTKLSDGDEIALFPPVSGG